MAHRAVLAIPCQIHLRVRHVLAACTCMFPVTARRHIKEEIVAWSQVNTTCMLAVAFSDCLAGWLCIAMCTSIITACLCVQDGKNPRRCLGVHPSGAAQRCRTGRWQSCRLCGASRSQHLSTAYRETVRVARSHQLRGYLSITFRRAARRPDRETHN